MHPRPKKNKKSLYITVNYYIILIEIFITIQIYYKIK